MDGPAGLAALFAGGMWHEFRGVQVDPNGPKPSLYHDGQDDKLDSQRHSLFEKRSVDPSVRTTQKHLVP